MPATNTSSSSSRKPLTSSTAGTALKAIFQPSSAAPRDNSNHHPPTSFLLELFRTKSFSASNASEVEIRSFASSSIVQGPVIEYKEEEEFKFKFEEEGEGEGEEEEITVTDEEDRGEIRVWEEPDPASFASDLHLPRCRIDLYLVV